MNEVPISVLVVDDEEDFSSTLVTRLALRGFDAARVGSGDEALAALEDRPVHVVLLDLKMPGMSGIETLRVIRKRMPDIKVIVLTGHGGVGSGVEGMQTGATDYLRKPIPISSLCIAIEAAAGRPRGVEDPTCEEE